MHYTNISGYQFKTLEKLTELQVKLREFCQSHEIKGTILISHEGINIFLCALHSQILDFYQYLAQLDFQIEFKESNSNTIPFKYLRVKIKKEIITMGVPEVQPQNQRAPYVSAAQFEQWLNEEKDLVILDTRNDYEVRIGKFKNAIDLNIQHFGQFPKESLQQLAQFKDKTIVTYCTGGIRCEKAAPFLISAGFKNVFQLEGGIIKYLENSENRHYEGECFVFDKRMAVDNNLRETQTVQCHICRNPVTEQEQKSVSYKTNTSCPQCAL